MYFDNGINSADDNVPNSGTLNTRLPCPLPVTLDSFGATATAGGVQLTWNTSSELDIQGYHVLRSATGKREDAQRLTETLIPAAGSGVAGSSYSFTDTSADKRASYSYWLQTVSSAGGTEDYGPITYSPAITGGTKVYLPLVRR